MRSEASDSGVDDAGGALILGIETSCDETACAVVRDRVVRSSVVASQHDLHAEYGGVVPEIASRAHVAWIIPVIQRALREAGVTLEDLAGVAVGHRPGLIGSLLVGVSAAKALAWTLGVPLIGVDHVHAHLYAPLLRVPGGGEPGLDARDAYPAIGLVVSGGHTSVYRVDSPTSLARLGATIDDALGEAFDKAATILGLPHPGGPNLERCASSPGADERAHDLPVSRLAPDSLDFSFSGLKTAVLYAVRGTPGPGGAFERDASALGEPERVNLAASFQRAACRAVELKLARAIERMRGDGIELRTLLAGGGVTANGAIRTTLGRVAAEHGLALAIPAMDLCVDNGAMIAGLGAVHLREGRRDPLSLAPQPTTAC